MCLGGGLDHSSEERMCPSSLPCPFPMAVGRRDQVKTQGKCSSFTGLDCHCPIRDGWPDGWRSIGVLDPGFLCPWREKTAQEPP